MSKPKIAIIGAGVGGLTTAWALARRGAAVTVFEQGAIPNPVASSVDEHRIIRHAYGAMRGYALMIPQAFAAWQRLWDDLGESHLVRAPATYCLRMELDWYTHVSACLDHMGVAYRDLPLDSIARDLPMVNRTDLYRVVETQGAGMLRAAEIVRHLARYLPTQGVTLTPHAEITEFDLETGLLHGARFDEIVVAAGAWLPRLLPGLVGAPRASVQTVAYLEPPAELAEAWSRAPMLLNRLPTPAGGAYILPPRAGLRLKAGDYNHTFVGDPQAPRVPLAEHVENILQACRMAIADFDRYRVIETKACFYTVTNDDRFVLRRGGARGWIVSACSGHGFKFAALMGEAAADGVMGLRSERDVSDFMASRRTEHVLDGV